MLRVRRIVLQGYQTTVRPFPVGTRPLSVTGQHETPRLHVLVDEDAERAASTEEFRITVARTDDPVEGALDPHVGDNVARYVRPKGKYCGTYVSPKGNEYHVFFERRGPGASHGTI